MSTLADDVAREVMGWPPKSEVENMHHEDCEHCKFAALVEGWSPDTRWDHCGMVIDTMQERGWLWESERREEGIAHYFWAPAHPDKLSYEGYCKDGLEHQHKIAICRAALAVINGCQQKSAEYAAAALAAKRAERSET